MLHAIGSGLSYCHQTLYICATASPMQFMSVARMGESLDALTLRRGAGSVRVGHAHRVTAQPMELHARTDVQATERVPSVMRERPEVAVMGSGSHSFRGSLAGVSDALGEEKGGLIGTFEAARREVAI